MCDGETWKEQRRRRRRRVSAEPELVVHVSRIRSLEGQVTAIQSTLTDLVSTLRAGMAAPAPAPLPPPLQHLSDFSLFTPDHNFGFPPKQEVLIGSRFEESEPSSTPSHPSHTSPYIPLDAGKHNGSMPGLPMDIFRAPVSATIPMPSLPPSRLGSPGADQDILSPEEITNPLGALSNMAGLVEAAVERAREEESPLKRPLEGPLDRPHKKTRFNHEEPSGPAIIESQNLAPLGSRKSKRKRVHIHAYPDVVTEGFMTEEEGKELLQMSVSKDDIADARFYSGASNFIPCFDPDVDQWDS